MTPPVGVTTAMQPDSPTKPPPSLKGMGATLADNVMTMRAREAEQAAAMPLADRIAARITRFTGSMMFVVLHLVAYGSWVAINLGLIPAIPRFDETFVLLATEASIEAIFLSTFVLISQNRMGAMADRRADLDLHINLLTEHELTKLSILVGAIADKLDVRSDADDAMSEVQQDVDPVAVMDAIETTKADANGS